jgi:lipopolysaccharide export LptBFGC system permease protein LptF
MITEVDKYKGWDISFDTDKETFFAYSSVHDSEITGKVSYAATKKYIDDFIATNETFKPFNVQRNPIGSNNLSIITIVGIRKDGVFVYDENGKKNQISKYTESDIILFEPENQSIIIEYNRMRNEAETLRKSAENYIKTNLKVKTLAEIKKELL